MKNVDLIIHGGTLCTINASHEIRTSTSIVIHEKTILEIRETAEVKKLYTSIKEIDATDCIVMPGLVNTHTHSPLTYLRGIREDINLMTWLNEVIWPLEKNFISEDFVFHATELAICEMMLSGTTTFNDSYFFSKEVAKAAKSMGMRCVAGELIFDHISPIGKTVEETFAVIEENLEDFKSDDLISIALAPHSLYACSLKNIKRAANLASRYGTLLNILISESAQEVGDIQERLGDTPIGLLHREGLLNANLIATHCVHLTDRDIELLAKSMTGISHNPESNMKLGNGVAPITQLLSKGAVVGIGTDGAASNNDLSLISEIGFAAKLQKGYFRDATLFNAHQAMEMLTINGAKVLHLDKKIGSIEVGKLADIILVDLNEPNMIPMYDPYSHVIYSAQSSDVKTVIINGKVVIEDRVIFSQNLKAVKQNALRYSADIKNFFKR